VCRFLTPAPICIPGVIIGTTAILPPRSSCSRPTWPWMQPIPSRAALPSGQVSALPAQTRALTHQYCCLGYNTKKQQEDRDLGETPADRKSNNVPGPKQGILRRIDCCAVPDPPFRNPECGGQVIQNQTVTLGCVPLSPAVMQDFQDFINFLAGVKHPACIPAENSCTAA